jgi:glycogen debranching enzyme
MQKEKELKEKVRTVLFGNMIKGYSKELDFEYCYTKPARGRYPFQYFWDTCFHAHMLLSIGEHEHAKWHIQTLFKPQHADGFIGNIIYWKRTMPARISDILQIRLNSLLKLRPPHMSSIVQPPLVAQTVKRIYEKTKDTGFVKEMLPKLKLYYKWLQENRDFDGDDLLTIITTFESGMDWKPTYDPVLGLKRGKAGYKLFLKVISVDLRNFVNNYSMTKIRNENYFTVKDAGFNAIYAKNLDELSGLCAIAGDPDAEKYASLSIKVINRMIEVMYDEEDAAFYDVFGRDNRKLKIMTPTIFYPVIINHISSDLGKKVIVRHFNNSREFKAPFPIPSLAVNDPAFNPEQSIFLWRGPTWIINNWFMHKYLINSEQHENAGTLMKSMIDLVEKSGFREYYNPFTGEGYGAHDFTWAGLILDMYQDEKHEKNI